MMRAKSTKAGSIQRKTVAANNPSSVSYRRSKTPLATVICPNAQQVPVQIRKRVETVKTMNKSIHRSAIEAISADKNGSLEVSKKYPGIPEKKFSIMDMPKYGTVANKDWSVQAAYPVPTEPGYYHVLFEGWAMMRKYMYTESELKAMAPLVVEDAKKRDDFLKHLARMYSGELSQSAKNYIQSSISKPSRHGFWLYEDIGYFHSKIQHDFGSGSIIYMNLTKKRVSPPKFTFLAVNAMKLAVLEKCQKIAGNEKFDDLEASQRQLASDVPQQNDSNYKLSGCEKPSQCVCRKIYYLIYASKEAHTFNNTKQGYLNLSGFSLQDFRIVIECSDRCGCSLKCPRRQTQRGQKKTLVVSYHQDKDFILIAGDDIKAGEFIGPYTGEVKNSGRAKNASYDIDIRVISEKLIISALNYGNHLRFISHSCDPNSFYAAVHSRTSEADPLLPAVGVFAAKDIRKGEEITAMYWTKEDVKNATNWIDCLCKSTNCIKRIPK